MFQLFIFTILNSIIHYTLNWIIIVIMFPWLVCSLMFTVNSDLVVFLWNLVNPLRNFYPGLPLLSWHLFFFDYWVLWSQSSHEVPRNFACLFHDFWRSYLKLLFSVVSQMQDKYFECFFSSLLCLFHILYFIYGGWKKNQLYISSFKTSMHYIKTDLQYVMYTSCNLCIIQ